MQDRQEGNMIYSTGTEDRTPGETYNVGHQSIGQQVGGIYKDQLDFTSDEPHGTATPKHDKMEQVGAEARSNGGSVEKTNEDAMEGRTGYGEHVAPTGDKQPRHKTSRKTVQHDEPFVTSFHTFTTSFHTWIRTRAPNSQQVPKKSQSPPQSTWRPGKSEQNINDDESMLINNLKSRDERQLDSAPASARRHAEQGKPLKGQNERDWTRYCWS